MCVIVGGTTTCSSLGVLFGCQREKSSGGNGMNFGLGKMGASTTLAANFEL